MNKLLLNPSDINQIDFFSRCVVDSDVVQHGGIVGEEAGGPERHPGE